MRRCVWITVMMVMTGTMTSVAFSVIERVPHDQGVALHLTYSMTQTGDGFLWFGTMYGLVRFDGYTYRTFRHDPTDTTSLSNDDIVSLYEDRTGDLWVGTYGGGVNRLDRSTGIFHRYRAGSIGEADVVWAIREDHTGRILLATESHGLRRIGPDRSSLNGFLPSSPATREEPRSLTSLEIDSAGTVWGVSRGRLLKYGAGFDSGSQVDLGIVRGVPIEATTILAGSGGVLWVGTSRHGVYRFHTTRGDMQPVVGDGFEHGENLFRVNALVNGGNATVYAGTSKGVIVIGKEGTIIGSHRYNPQDDRSLSGNGVISLCKDQGGILWVSSYTDGVAKVYPNEIPFRTFFASQSGVPRTEVRSVVSIGPSRILAATSGGLYEVDLDRETSREVVVSAEAGIGKGMITSLRRDRTGDLWLGTVTGLYLATPDYRVKRFYRYNVSDSTSISSDLVLCILQDRAGGIWAGTPAGLNYLVDQRGGFRRYKTGPDGLRNNYILSLFEDSEGNIWIGTYGGTSVLNRKSGTFRHFVQDPTKPDGISSNYALSFCEDGDGVLWVGTGGGLNRFDREKSVFSHYLGRHGLPNAVISGILDAGEGVLWLSTHFGLSRFDRRSRTFSGYDTRDGISSNMFLQGAATRTPDGHMVFGGSGLTAFLPSDISRGGFAPHVEFTDFSLVGSVPGIGRTVRSGDTLSLSYDQNYFTAEFAALDFLRPSRASYTYMLEGVDAGWVAAGTARTATYSNLSPGTYRLKVKGTNGEGVWSTREATLHLQIMPPFWRTSWFTVLSVVFIAGLLFFAHRTRLQRKLDRARELARAREEAAEAIRRKAAQDFHDELGHRLTKIGLFAELVRKKIGSSLPEASSQLEKIIDSAQGLTDETRNFLWALDPHQDSLADLVEYLNGFGEELFERTGIDFHPAGVSESMKEFKLTMDFRRHLALILKEAMNNALKHSGCSNIYLAVHLNDGDLFLALRDDGKGCVAPSNGNGNGMKNMRMRAERIRGAIQIESKPGRGTRVVFASPVTP